MNKLFAILLIVFHLFALTSCSIPAGSTNKDSAGTVTEDGSKDDGKNAAESSGNTVNTTESLSSSVNTGDDGKMAAGTDPKVGRIPVVIYYQDADGFLIPVTRWIEKQQGIAKAALMGLIDSAITREELQYYGLYPVIPINTDILGINIKDGIAIVDFDRNFLNLADKASERNMLGSIVYTLTGFKTINGVRILINGYEHKKLNNGTDISGIFSRASIMLNSPETAGGDDIHKADVFMLKKANDNYTYFAPVSVLISGEGDEPDPGQIIEQLTEKNTEQNVFNEIPEGTKVLSAAIQNGILTVDLSSELGSYGGGSAREDAIIKQILYTAGQIQGVLKVRILINGKNAELPEGSDLSKPMAVPRINDIIDNS